MMLRAIVVVVGIGLVVGSWPLVAFSDAGADSDSLIPVSSTSMRSVSRPQDGWLLLARRSSTQAERLKPTISPQTDRGLQDARSEERNLDSSQEAAAPDQQEARTWANVPSDNVEETRAVEERRLGSESPFKYMEIEVSHSAHTFRLLGVLPSGQTQELHHCRVGLGGPGFPTPVGVYYVTHIYDDEPWWIPPKDRAWAAGQSPSKKVYGGTMAPLLKKRPVRLKKQVSEPEDMIAGQVQLDDYGYRFHGTNQPRSIGRNQSHGCVRMIPADAKKVASLIIQHVGQADRKESENGSFVVLKRTVRLNLIK